MNKILPLWLVSLIATLLLYSAQSLAETPSTGWLSHEDHPPVSVKLELTGHYEAERNLLPDLLHVELRAGKPTGARRGKAAYRQLSTGRSQLILKISSGTGRCPRATAFRALIPWGIRGR